MYICQLLSGDFYHSHLRLAHGFRIKNDQLFTDSILKYMFSNLKKLRKNIYKNRSLTIYTSSGFD